MASNKNRDSGCCSVNLIKYFLHIFNVIFLIAGLVVLGIGVWTVLEKHKYISLLSGITYPLAAYVLIAAGVLVIAAAIIGCSSVWKEHRPMILCYTFLLLLIFLMEAMVGLLSYVYAGQVKEQLQESLNATFLDNYSIDPVKTSAIDHLQQQFKCCGANDFEDWAVSKWRRSNATKNLVPDSCCKTYKYECGKSQHPSNINSNSCLEILADEMKHNLYILSNVGLGICVIQVFGMILTCCLYIKLKNVLD